MSNHHSVNTNCSNCGTELVGKHCHECGQKSNVSRLTLHDIFHEVWHALTHTDKGIFKLIIDLIVRPRQVYFNYFNGQRKKYFSPVLFFLVTAGILAFLYPHVFDYEDKITNKHNEFGRELYHLTKYRALLLLPVQALLLWIIFIKRYNLAEVTVFLLFCWGFTFAIRIVFMPLYFPLIRHKTDLDNIFIIGSFLILWTHTNLVLARGGILYLIAAFLLVNVFWIMDGLLQFYILFGNTMLQTNPYGIHSFFELLKAFYTF